MAIRIRNVNGVTVALCAAMSNEMEGDVYLDDNAHHALTTKFGLDFYSEGFLKDPMVDDFLIPIMEREQGGKLFHVNSIKIPIWKFGIATIVKYYLLRFFYPNFEIKFRI